ncbi:MAG: DUF11 domain-containing protein [Candidatus Levybacteria bacterium]|nr:DUF11 domain-containing protein [Candidatus Levybacteria bacterium]
MYKAFTIVLVALFGLFLVSGANAASCRPIYGGGENCLPDNTLSIDKKIASPIDSSFADNLDGSQRFKADEVLNFQITVTNKGKKSLKNVEVKDSLPPYLTFVSGPGSYDQKSKSLTIKISELKANESRKYVLVASVNAVPRNVCLANYATVKASNSEADDNSKFCLLASQGVPLEPGQTTKGGLPLMPSPKGISQTPPTGPELISLLGLIPAFLAGAYLRRR